MFNSKSGKIKWSVGRSVKDGELIYIRTKILGIIDLAQHGLIKGTLKKSDAFKNIYSGTAAVFKTAKGKTSKAPFFGRSGRKLKEEGLIDLRSKLLALFDNAQNELNKGANKESIIKKLASSVTAQIKLLKL